MNRVEFKNIATKILQEAFDTTTEGWNFNEDEEVKLKYALFGPATIERIANVAESFVMNNENEEAVHAHVEKVMFPSGKDIQISLSVPSDVARRLAAAQLSGCNVVLYSEQTTLPIKAMEPAEEEDDNPNQMSIGEFVEELDETPDFSEEGLVEV